MAQRMAYYCDCCGESCSGENPLVIYVVAGNPSPEGGYVDPEQLPPFVRQLLKQPTSRVEFCAHCFGEMFPNVNEGELARVLPDPEQGRP
jgi:hypothetical protein